MKALARTFKNGGSQAVRLPKEFRFPGKIVSIEHAHGGVLLKDKDDLKRRARIFASLAGSCPEFPVIEPNLAPDLPREPMI
jgi:hypothetical protein